MSKQSEEVSEYIHMLKYSIAFC